MVIDSHMHLMDSTCFDEKTYKRLGQTIPADTNIDDLVFWMKEAGIGKCVCMAQDMTRVWNSEFGENAVDKAFKKYPDFFIPFCSVEPMDKEGRFSTEKYKYVIDRIDNHGYRGILFTPPYGQYNANDKTMYPFYEFANDRGVVVQFHHSAAGGPTVLAHTRYVQMENLNDVTFDFPNLKIVVEHIGYPFSEYLFTMMVNDKNLYTDLAMLYHRPFWLTFNLVLAKELGVIDRVMFASDFVSTNNDLFSDNPTKDLKKWIDLIRYGMNEICEKSSWPSFNDDEINGILYRNAARLYDL